MKLYVVKNDDGKLWDYDDERWSANAAGDYTTYEWAAEITAEKRGGHVVELVEKPELVEVSEEEAEMLEQAKCDDDPAELIVGFVNSRDNYDDDRKAEERLMRAYVIGWTVENPKRYLVRVPHANRHYYYQKCDSGEVIPVWDMETEPPTQFTAAEIEHYELTDCERVEVTDDEQ